MCTHTSAQFHSRKETCYTSKEAYYSEYLTEDYHKESGEERGVVSGIFRLHARHNRGRGGEREEPAGKGHVLNHFDDDSPVFHAGANNVWKENMSKKSCIPMARVRACVQLAHIHT